MRLLALLLVAQLAHAAPPPVVIHDDGGTLPLRPLAEASGVQPSADDPRFEGQEPDPAPPSLFPLATPGLAVGTVERRATGPKGRTLPCPLFVMGADPHSLRWLATHRGRLAAIGAAGLLVEAPTEGAYQRVLAAGEGLPIALVPGGDVARMFGLTHYPVLIRPEWIEQ